MGTTELGNVQTPFLAAFPNRQNLPFDITAPLWQRQAIVSGNKDLFSSPAQRRRISRARKANQLEIVI
jgi:hypothetical protein